MILRSTTLLLCACLAPAPLLPAQALLKDLALGTNSSATGGWCKVGSKVAFRGTTPARGSELWLTDGTAPGTQTIELIPGPASGMLSLAPVSLGDLALFVGDNGTDTGLFRSGPQLAAPVHISFLRVNTRRSTSWSALHVHQQEAYLLAGDGQGRLALYRSDGSPLGTKVVHILAGRRLGEMRSLGGLLFFTIHTTSSQELWVSDGTRAGTRLLRRGTSSLRHLTAVGRHLYFVDSSAAGGNLWRSDGSPIGTQQVSGIQGSVQTVTALGQTAIAAVLTQSNAAELWRVGSAAPQRYAVIAAASTTAGPSLGLISAPGADRVFVIVGAPRPTLWSSDGSPAGTLAFHKNIRLALIGVTPFANSLLYAATDGTGTEPWISDGTIAGTRRYADLFPGKGSSTPRGFTVIPDFPSGPMLFFQAYDKAHGAEPRILPLATTGAAALLNWRQGCGGKLLLSGQGGEPRIGSNAFGLLLQGSRPQSMTAFVIDTNPGTTVTGCQVVLPSLFISLVLSDTHGQSSLALSIPKLSTLIGTRAYVQAWAAQTQGPLLGVATSSATLLAVIGR